MHEHYGLKSRAGLSCRCFYSICVGMPLPEGEFALKVKLKGLYHVKTRTFFQSLWNTITACLWLWPAGPLVQTVCPYHVSSAGKEGAWCSFQKSDGALTIVSLDPKPSRRKIKGNIIYSEVCHIENSISAPLYFNVTYFQCSYNIQYYPVYLKMSLAASFAVLSLKFRP